MLDGISGGNAVFDTAKLDWMNGQYLAALSDDHVRALVVPVLAEAGVWPPSDDRAHDGWLDRLLTLLRPRAKRLTEFAEQARPFLVDRVEYDPDAAAKHLRQPDVASHLQAVADAIREVPTFDETSVEAALRATAERLGVKAGVLIHPVRVAMTGRTTSPGIFEVLVLLGRPRAIERLEAAIAFVGQPR